HAAEEDFLLDVRILGQYKKRFRIKGRELVRGRGPSRRCYPGFIFSQQAPNRVQEGRLLTLEIKMQNDHGPAGAIISEEFLFHQRPDALEEVVAKSGLRSCSVRFVGDHDDVAACAGVNGPRQVLLDGDRKTGRESSIEPIGPAALVRIAV